MREKDFLRRLCEKLDELSTTLKRLSAHPTLTAPFDRILSDIVIGILRAADLNVLFEVNTIKRSQMKKLLYFGSPAAITYQCLQLVTFSAENLLNDINNSGKIIEYAQYKFVDDLAQIWLSYTLKIPEIGRWSPLASFKRTSPITRFPQFVHFLEPKITAETIRTVLAAFKDDREREVAGAGNEEPTKI